MTDESNTYAKLGDDFANHDAVDHGREEWGYTDRKTETKISTNSAEGFYSDIQTRHERRLSALRRKASPSIRCRIRFQAFQSRQAWH